MSLSSARHRARPIDPSGLSEGERSENADCRDWKALLPIGFAVDPLKDDSGLAKTSLDRTGKPASADYVSRGGITCAARRFVQVGLRADNVADDRNSPKSGAYNFQNRLGVTKTQQHGLPPGPAKGTDRMQGIWALGRF